MDHLIIRVGDHRQQLCRLLATTCGVVRIVSPYVTESTILGDAANREVRLLTALNKKDIVFGTTSLDALKRLIDKGVECRFVPDDAMLHAKVYIFGNVSAVVTSANFTRRALDKNIEVGAFVDESAVQTLTAWFDRLWNTAKVLDAQTVAKLKQETASLRLAWSDFLDKSGLTDDYADHPGPEPNPPATPVSYFLCNTNRRHNQSHECEQLMKAKGYAAAWEDFNHRRDMRQVQAGDIVLLYVNRVGIVAIGRAKSKCETLGPKNPRRLFNGFTAREWRVPVRWIVQVDDKDACRWPGVLPPTFHSVSSDMWNDQRNKVIRHFFGDSEVVERVRIALGSSKVSQPRPPEHNCSCTSTASDPICCAFSAPRAVAAQGYSRTDGPV